MRAPASPLAVMVMPGMITLTTASIGAAPGSVAKLMRIAEVSDRVTTTRPSPVSVITT